MNRGNETQLSGIKARSHLQDGVQENAAVGTARHKQVAVEV